MIESTIDRKTADPQSRLDEHSIDPPVNECTVDRHPTKRHSDNNRFKCRYEDCDYKTPDRCLLNSHIKYLHLNKSRIKCNECQFQCWGSVRLYAHIKTCHKSIKESHQLFNNCVNYLQISANG